MLWSDFTKTPTQLKVRRAQLLKLYRNSRSQQTIVNNKMNEEAEARRRERKRKLKELWSVIRRKQNETA
jgi:hypothetical protein